MAATISTTLAIICGTIVTTASVVCGGENVHLGIAGTVPITTMIGTVLRAVGAPAFFAGRHQGTTGDAGGEP